MSVKTCGHCGYEILPAFHGKPVTSQNKGRPTVHFHSACVQNIEDLVTRLIAGVKK